MTRPTEHNTHDFGADSPPDALPPQLADDLADLFDARLLVPAQVDDAVLADARRHLAPLRRRGSRRMWVGLVTGAAAAAAVGLTVWLGPMRGAYSPDVGAPVVRGDLNHDGVVDIVDAMLLEQRVAAVSGTALPLDAASEDMNGDGKVDRDDALELAQQSVALDKGGVL